MKTRIITTLLTAIFLVTATLSVNAQTTEQSFQKGIMKEEGEGNLPEAIEIFSSIVENSNADEALQAKALLHVGLCYEKLGRKEASRAYQKLIDNFPARKNEVSIARERLSRLILADDKAEKFPLQPKWTKVDIPTELSWSVALSPDGNELALVSDKKLWKLPLSSKLGTNIPGAPIQINTEGVEVEWTGLSWSRDGEWIAFNESPEFDSSGSPRIQAVYIVPSKGGKPEKIIENYRDTRVVNYRLSLSPNVKKLAFSSVKNNKQHIYSIHIEGKRSKQLVDFESREPVFSPDGKFIAFVQDQNRGIDSGNLGVWMVRADEGKPWKIADADKASSPVWSPDGEMIAFLDYTDGKNINIVQLGESKQAIKTISLNAPEGTKEIRLLAGWTPENRIGALIAKEMKFGLYTLPAEGGQAAQILKETTAYQPRWSKDGKQIYYVRKPPNENYKNYLASVPAEGGKGEPLSDNPLNNEVKQFSFQGGNRVSPDGKWIISSVWTKADTNTLGVHWPTSKIWKIATDGTDAIQITDFEGNYTDRSPCWSPDGKKIAFIRNKLKEDNMNFFGDANIYMTNESDSNPELIVSEKGTWMASLTWSPDGKKLAWTGSKKGENEPDMLKVFDLNKKEIFATYEIPGSGVNNETAWFPDSKKIAFNVPEGKVIKVLDIENGNIEDIETGLVDTEIYHLDLSPDGKRFVFGGYSGGGKEFWFVEDFLPLEKLAQTNKSEKEPEGIVIKQVWTGPNVDDMGQISRDGKFLSYVDWVSADLAIRNLKTKENKRLTHQGSWDEPYHYADVSLITEDGKNIIYSWYNDDDNYELRTINTDNPNPQTIYKPKNPEQIFPKLLYDNDQKVLVQRFSPGKTWYLASVDIDEGEINNLKDFEGNFAINLSISPDKKFFAFDFPNKKDEGMFDIHLLSVDDKKEFPLVEHPANDRLLGWIPGTNKLLFTSDRSGTTDVWAMNTSRIPSVNEPERILTNVGNINPLGYTTYGTLFYSTKFRRCNAYILPFNKSSGKIEWDLKEPLLGSILDPLWTKNGESMIYTEREKLPGVGWNYQLTFYDINTGNKKKLATNINFQGPPSFSPDGKSLLIVGLDKTRQNEENYNGGIFSVDILSGIATEIKVKEDISRSYCVEWDKEGKNIFYRSNNKIFKHNIVSGDEIEIYIEEKFKKPRILKKSWDGNHLLFDVQVNDSLKYIKSIPITGGNSKMLCSLKTSGTPIMFKKIDYATDGKFIYLAVDGQENGSVLYRVLSEGGEPEKIWQTKNRIAGLSIHPNENKIAISLYEGQVEIRKIENLKQEVEKIYAENE